MAIIIRVENIVHMHMEQIMHILVVKKLGIIEHNILIIVTNQYILNTIHIMQ